MKLLRVTMMDYVTVIPMTKIVAVSMNTNDNSGETHIELDNGQEFDVNESFEDIVKALTDA